MHILANSLASALQKLVRSRLDAQAISDAVRLRWLPKSGWPNYVSTHKNQLNT